MIPLFKVNMNSDQGMMNDVLQSGYIGQGQKVEEFEILLKKRFNTKDLVTTNSGTSALHLAGRLLNLWEDKNTVLTTALTCTATNWPFLANGFNLKWVDVDPTTLNIDLVDLERKIDEDTAAIVVVHWGGYPVDLEKLKGITDRAYANFGYHIPVVEDCAHAFGMTFKGQPLAKYHNYQAYSFQAIKHFTTVDGGMLVLPHGGQYRRAKLMRWYGIDRDGPRKDFRCEEDIAEWGYKFHMNDINASIGIQNLITADGVVQAHKENGKFFNFQLAHTQGVTLLDDRYEDDAVFWIYSMHVNRRDEFIEAMTRRGIMVSRVHERNDIHSSVKKFRSMLPALDEVSKTMVCIPCGWWLTDEDKDFIVDAIEAGW